MPNDPTSKSNGLIPKSGGHGGPRPGAGRKPKAEKYETEFESAEQRWVDKLPLVQETIEKLAKGGLKRITKKLMPAALVLTKEVQHDFNGNPKSVDVPAYPNEDPHKLICVEEVVETLAPDRAANQYIMDRILGKPTQSTEVTGKDGGPLEFDEVSLSDTDRAGRIAALLDACRARRDGPAASE